MAQKELTHNNELETNIIYTSQTKYHTIKEKKRKKISV